MKNKKTINFFTKKKLRGFAVTGLVALLVYLAFQFGSSYQASRMTTINRENRKLFANAEGEMRELPDVGADLTLYQQSCSFASVKFESEKQEPNCRVQRQDIIWNLPDGDAIKKYDEYAGGIISKYPKSKIKINREAFAKDVIQNEVEIFGLVNGNLNCYSIASMRSEDSIARITNTKARNRGSETARGLLITTSCYKRVPFQIYDELD